MHPSRVTVTPRSRQRDVQAQVSPSKVEAASPVTESDTVTSPREYRKETELSTALFRGSEWSPMRLSPASAIFKTPMIKSTKSLRVRTFVSKFAFELAQLLN